MKIFIVIIGFISPFLLSIKSCSETAVLPTPNNHTSSSDVAVWLTRKDGTMLLEKQPNEIQFQTMANSLPTLALDESKTFQSIEGFGYTLTGGSAEVILKMEATARHLLLQELFSNASSAIKINYLRLSIGASDLHEAPFTYDDMPSGELDLDLKEFSLVKDQAVLTLLKEILALNPQLKILATPWSAPPWMKDNASFIGGHLRPAYYKVYAQYFIRYIQEMQQKGFQIEAITPQNEPLNSHNNPSMLMTADEQNTFIKEHLGPALKQAGLSTKIIIYDHNCDRPDYPISILKDELTRAYIDGSAFHLYAGDISCLSTVKEVAPDKNLYFTEQYTSSTGNFGDDLVWHLKNVVIGSLRNHAKTVFEWNLASDPNFKPHTKGGCTSCKGALTIQGNQVTRNVAYYILAHAAKFIPRGAVRIQSSGLTGILSVAFKTPDGQKVLLLLNDGQENRSFQVRDGDKHFTFTLANSSVATLVWS